MNSPERQLMQDAHRYLENLSEERNAAQLYRILAQNEKNPKIADVYRRLAETEERHARYWIEELRKAGADAPKYHPSWRTRVLGWVARRFGVEVVLPALSQMESRNAVTHAANPAHEAIARDDRGHAMLLQQLSRTDIGGMEGSALARIEGRHRSAGGNALRAAVLGASDGLLSNFNLVMGVAGAALDNHVILLTGIAGLLACSISMALGEWISVQSSRELYQKQIATEKDEIERMPEEEMEELVLIYQARGMDETFARTMASQVMSNPVTALDALVRDELGIDPKELGGSAWEAAIASFLLCAVGAIVPVLPFIFMSGKSAIAGSATLSAFGLFLLGAAITLFTGKPVFSSGVRQVLIGLASAAAVFGVGHLIGVAVS
jgi:vacuolar iron transporter family protein